MNSVIKVEEAAVVGKDRDVWTLGVTYVDGKYFHTNINHRNSRIIFYLNLFYVNQFLYIYFYK